MSLESYYLVQNLSSILSPRTSENFHRRGMDFPPSPYAYLPTATEPSKESPNMAAVAVQGLPPAIDMRWDDRQPPSMTSGSRSRSQAERIELPSIRQAVPEIDLRGTIRDESDSRPDYGTCFPKESDYRDYVLSFLSKRRRLSAEDSRMSEFRDSMPPRVHRSPPRRLSRTQTVGQSPTRRDSSSYNREQWPSPSRRNSPFLPAPSLPSMRTAPQFEPPAGDFRPRLPSLPSLTLEREGATPQAPRGRTTWSDYALDNSRGGAQTYPQMGGSFDPPPQQAGYQSSSYPYGYQQPRVPSYPGPSQPLHHRSERSPFGSSNYHPGPSETYAHEPGSLPEGNRQRKRRGNLPKETTDKLRAWFVAHLTHPYPTEDEKQELMMQTGLQMNQISNWFINARRRQLPAMINNARTESEARSAITDEGGSRGPGSESDGYEDDYEILADKAGGGMRTDNA